MRAFSLLRDQPWYRKQAFDKGLKAAGFEVFITPTKARPGDVLLMWNRYGPLHEIACNHERDGGTVVIAENGYFGEGGTSPKFDVHPGGPKPHHYYSLSIGFHNGRGKWPHGDGSRWAKLGVELQPWRKDGDYILIAGNRSFGVGEQVMPSDWMIRCAARLAKTKKPIRMRAHPGNDKPKVNPLERDLEGACAVVVWSSTVALHALAQGIPTYIEAPYQIVKGASASGEVNAPTLPDRLPHFERMAWSQWRLEEIETGEPFRRLLAC